MSDKPNIADVVDLKQWTYVVHKTFVIPTYCGPLALPRGFLSDGASGLGIRDLEPLGFCAHDRLYVSPWVSERPVSKFQADMIYAQILMREWRVLEGVVRPLALGLLGWGAWRGYRKREKKNPNWWLTERFVPHALAWNFPDWRTENAVYVGAPLPELA